ncbi:mitochondrial substrate carrier family protein [Wolffia australiana]
MGSEPTSHPDTSQFNASFLHLNTLLLSNQHNSILDLSISPISIPRINPSRRRHGHSLKKNSFASTSLSTHNRADLRPRSLLKKLSTVDRALIGAMAGGIAGAFTYVCLLPIDTVKTKLQTKGAAQVYSSALDAAVKTFQASGVLGFYRGVSAVVVGSAVSSSIYFGTCEFAKAVLSTIPSFPALLVPPAAGAAGNIVSSAVMVPKELITQRMQAGATGRSWEVLLRILQKDGVLGLYAGYSATLLRNLPAGILSYSSFEYLKGFVLGRTGRAALEPAESVACGALAGAISALLTTPLDVVKTRLMTQMHGEGGKRITETVGQILTEEGWQGLFRGMGPRVLHSACFAAIGYFAFETARLSLLNQYVQRKDQAENIRDNKLD